MSLRELAAPWSRSLLGKKLSERRVALVVLQVRVYRSLDEGGASDGGLGSQLLAAAA